MFSAGKLHAFLLILSAPLIAYGVNLLRAFSLIINPGMDVLTIHTAQGVIFFMIGFSLLYAEDSLFLRLAGKNKDGGKQFEQSGGKDREVSTDIRGKRLVILASLFFVLLLASGGLPRWEPRTGDSGDKLTIPRKIGDWIVAKAPKMKHNFLGSVQYTEHSFRYYTRDNEYVVLFVGYDDRRRRDRSFLSDKNAYQGEVGIVEERALINPDAGDLQIESIVSLADRGRILTWHWYEGVASISEEVWRAFLAMDQSPFRRSEGALVVRLATFVPPDPNGKYVAEQRLQDFFASLSALPLDQDSL
jgi:hypothetical protein